MKLSGAFNKENEAQSDLWIGEFHAEVELDDGEKIRAIFPEAISLPTEYATYLLCDSQYLLAGHTYHSDLCKPRLELKQGGTYTMDVIAAHKILHILPISAKTQANHRTVLFHLPTPYEPPTYRNNATHRRPDIRTPSAMIWHTRLACACKEVMQKTQRNVIGMNVRQDSWKSLDALLLPCSACVAGTGTMRKANSPSTQTYSDIRALTTQLLQNQNPARHFEFAVSRTPATVAQTNQRNKVVSVDLAIINKQNLPDVFNVFALFIDNNIGLVHAELQLTRGQAGEALEGYIQQWGVP
jgi:hypothetical protein